MNSLNKYLNQQYKNWMNNRILFNLVNVNKKKIKLNIYIYLIFAFVKFFYNFFKINKIFKVYIKNCKMKQIDQILYKLLKLAILNF